MKILREKWCQLKSQLSFLSNLDFFELSSIDLESKIMVATSILNKQCEFSWVQKTSAINRMALNEAEIIKIKQKISEVEQSLSETRKSFDIETLQQQIFVLQGTCQRQQSWLKSKIKALWPHNGPHSSARFGFLFENLMNTAFSDPSNPWTTLDPSSYSQTHIKFLLKFKIIVSHPEWQHTYSLADNYIQGFI